MEDSIVDVLVSDLTMPGMNGLQLVSKVNSTWPETICMILSGTADMAAMLDAINIAEVFRFYTKPLAIPELVEGVEAALNSKTAVANGISSGMGAAALDQLPIAVIVIDQRAKPVFVNRAGAAVLEDGGALSVDSGGICRSDSADFQTTVDLFFRKPEKAKKGLFFTLPGTGDLRPLSVFLSPFVGDIADSHPYGTLAVMYIVDPNNPVEPFLDAVKIVFDLTDSEAKLAVSLVKGMALDEAAAICGLTVSSARTYLKRVFSKTNTNRQSDLIRLILTSVPYTAAH